MTNRGESEVYEMLFAVVKSLVDWPQEVSITKGLRGGHPLFTVVTHPQDVGKVIGSGGRTARAIRIIMSVNSARLRMPLQVDIVNMHEQKSSGERISE